MERKFFYKDDTSGFYALEIYTDRRKDAISKLFYLRVDAWSSIG